jgi:hypothetical protein
MAQRNQVFISYSHHDQRWLARLQVHLRPLVRNATIDLWDDTKIQAGAQWQDEIARALSRARIAIVLVSADFLASDYVAQYELPSLLEAARDDGAVILPVIVSASGYTRTGELSQFQAINDPRQPLNGVPESDQEAVFEKVAARVEEIVGQQELRARFEGIRDTLDEQQHLLQAQQAIINNLVKYMLSAPIFSHLAGIALLHEYKFWDGPMTRELYFLRDIGFIKPRNGDFVPFDSRLNGANLPQLLEPTPIGWSCLRLRKIDVAPEWLQQSLRQNLREDVAQDLGLELAG